MNTADLIEYAVNVLAQYRCGHLDLFDVSFELASLGIHPDAIVLLLSYEDGKKR